MSAAEEWLTLIDKGEYGRGWTEAAGALRGQVPSEDFQKQLA